METETRLPAALLDTKICALVPQAATGSLVGAIEVMVQEGIRVFSLPAGRADDLARLAATFGPRATFIAHDVELDQLDEVLAGPAPVVMPRWVDAGIVARIHDAGRAVVGLALTPTEIRATASTGVDAVVVAPAEVMGASYPEFLADLTPGVVLGARGGLGAYSARRWVENGAAFVMLDAALVGDAFTGGPLGSLRERCQTFVTAVE